MSYNAQLEGMASQWLQALNPSVLPKPETPRQAATGIESASQEELAFAASALVETGCGMPADSAPPLGQSEERASSLDDSESHINDDSTPPSLDQDQQCSSLTACKNTHGHNLGATAKSGPSRVNPSCYVKPGGDHATSETSAAIKSRRVRIQWTSEEESIFRKVRSSFLCPCQSILFLGLLRDASVGGAFSAY